MKRPKIASVKISWIDEQGSEHHNNFSETSLEEAGELISKMTGTNNKELHKKILELSEDNIALSSENNLLKERLNNRIQDDVDYNS